MPKTAAEKAIDDAVKARDVVGRAQKKHTLAVEKATEANAEVNRAQRELKWRLAHPDLPEEFDLDAHLANQDSDDGFPDDQAQAELDEAPTLEDVVDPAADVDDTIQAEQEFQASENGDAVAVAEEPKSAPKSRAKAAKAKEPEPEPDVSGDAPDDDPFGDE